MELVFPDSFNVVQPVPCTSLVHEVGSQELEPDYCRGIEARVEWSEIIFKRVN